MLAHIVGDFSGMPPLMKRLALVQFFTWSALYTMWVFTTPVVARNFYASPNPASAGYQEAGNWVGVLFAVYNGVAAIAALALHHKCAHGGRRGGAVASTIAGLLCAFALLGAASIGMFVLPIVVALLIAARLTPDGPAQPA
jgi:maltose/moltooligosaccharide transporter